MTEPTSQTGHVGQVVVGVDGSPGSLAAVDWAAQAAQSQGRALHLVCAWEPDDSGDPAAGGATTQDVADARLHSALRRAMDAGHAPDQVVLSTPRGPVGPALVDVARGAALFVLGTSYLEEKARPGPVTLYCLQHAHGPVVFVPAVRPAGVPGLTTAAPV